MLLTVTNDQDGNMSVITDPGDSTDGASMTNDGTAAAVMDNVSLSVSDGTSTVPVTVIGGDTE